MKQIFINLPVENVDRSMEFYTKLGFVNNPLFTDGEQKCMVWSEHIYVMLISKRQFKKWNKKSIPDTRLYATANFTLPVESLAMMDEIVENGLNASGTEPNPMLDEGFMQVRSIEDFDGHVWGIICLDIEKFRKRKESSR